MNQITTQIDKSDYEIYNDFLNIKIDNEYLDEFLERLYPGQMYQGTIPTLLFAMEIDAESKIVWERILPDVNMLCVCPILMCPDDRDFSCTLIIAEIECLGETVRWKRMGLDVTKDPQPKNIGSEVDWFEKVPVLEFHRSEYLSMIQDFKIQFEIDKADYIRRSNNS